MIKIKVDKNYLLRIEPEKELFSEILNFAKEEKIKSGFFIGIGASRKFTLGRYNEKTKDYDWKKINQQMEIANLTGNLTFKDNHHYLHIHAVLNDKGLKAIAGHLKELIVFPTCEILFFPFNKKINRDYNKLTNLYLIVDKFKKY